MKLNIKKVALFGTSADPPTIGHKKILEKLAGIHSNVITYASNNPSKKHKENLFFRSLLLKTLIDEIDNPKILFNKEISSPWAIESIKKCKKFYNFDQIEFVIGSDLISDIFLWKNIDQIFQEVKLIIIKREGYPIKSDILELINANKGIFEISSFTIPEISSSMIRLETQYSYLPKSLIEIVKKNNLYNSSKIV